jgi:RpiR family carbohydrate utilization transcriptional regulator
MASAKFSANRPSPVQQKDDSLISRISPGIRAAYGSLRPAEQRVADFVLSRPAFAMSLSARELGAICRTSEATVIRFCQALGYKGLTGFRAALSHEISVLERQSFWQVGSDDTSTELISKTISQGIQALQSIMLALKPEEFERAFKAIARAKTFLLFGAGGSAYLAGHIGLEFIRIGVPIRTFIDYFSQMHTAAQLGEGDVAFGISYSGVTQSVIDILTTARDGGALTICLSNFAGTPITKVADIKLTTGRQIDTFLFKSGWLDHKIGQLLVLEALVTAVALEMNRTAESADDKEDATGDTEDSSAP